jgi:hypothetical protein
MPDTGPGTGTEGRTDTGTEGRTDTGAQTTAEAQPSFPEARAASTQGNTVSMLGNQLGSTFSTVLPSSSSSRSFATTVVPAVRGFRISENESPAPIDRVLFNFNYFEDVNNSVNRRFGGALSDVRVYRETFGVEKTCLDGNLSIGLRLPIDTLNADTTLSTINGDHTDFGDITLILKYALLNDPHAGRTLSVGLATTFPTGPSSFAGSGITTFHETVLQPFAGYLCNMGSFFVHGFIGFDVPTDSNDVTDFFYSAGAGYHLGGGCQDGSRLIADVVPTLEAHLTDPLNHRGAFRLDDPAASTDTLSLTGGVTVVFGRGCTLALGLNTPITGPKPYNWEFLAQFNLRFGAWRGVPGGPTSILGF